MALILCLETATRVCSVSLSNGLSLLGIRESETSNAHSSKLTVFVDEILKEAGHTLQQLDAIAVSMGPGSYTGLRIGVATAKGLCYALDKPMIAIPTLQAMAVGINSELKIKNFGGEEIEKFRISDFGFRISDFGLRIADLLILPMIAIPTLQAMAVGINSELKIKNFGEEEIEKFRISDLDCGFRISDFGLRIC